MLRYLRRSVRATAPLAKPPNMPPEIVRRGSADAHPLAEVMERAFDAALSGLRQASPYAQRVSGMSGQKYRGFISGLIGALPDARYLEVGSWMGSTLCAAVDNNAVTATVIDNWSEFGGPMAAFFANLGNANLDRARVSVFNSDFRAVRWDAISSHNVYLFDGPHTYQDQYDGLALAKPALDDVFVFIIDDWNWPDVRAGTWAAVEANKLELLYAIEVRSTNNDHHPCDQGLAANEESDWHNGYCMIVLRKLL